VIAPGRRDDYVTATEAVLPHEMWRDVRIAGLREIAVRGAPDEPPIARRIEPPLRLGVRDDWSWRLVLLVVALSPSAAIATVTTPVAVELLLGATAVLTSIAAMIAMVAVLTVVPVLRSFRLLGGRWGARLACVPRFGRSLCGRWRGRCGWSVLGGHERGGRRRGVGIIACVGWCVGPRVAVGVRVALFGGGATIRARPSAATVRASAFGHATMFVMGCLLATIRRDSPLDVAVLL